VQSQLIHHRPEPNPRLDAIVCAGPENVCREWSPVGWQIRMYGVVGWSLPPDRAPTTGP